MAAPGKKTAAAQRTVGQRAKSADGKQAIGESRGAPIQRRSAGKVEVLLIRRGLGVNRKTFSRLSGYSERAIAAWEAGKALSEPSRQRMSELHRLQQALSGVMQQDFVRQWLQTPNDAFGGLKPVEVIERGEIDRIWRMVYLLESGGPG